MEFSPVSHTPTPALQADECSRIARTIARILRTRVFASDALAQCAAAEIASALVEQHAGEFMYIPMKPRTAAAGQRHIAESLRELLTPEQIASSKHRAPEGVLELVAKRHDASRRTVARVLGQMRADLKP